MLAPRKNVALWAPLIMWGGGSTRTGSFLQCKRSAIICVLGYLCYKKVPVDTFPLAKSPKTLAVGSTQHIRQHAAYNTNATWRMGGLHTLRLGVRIRALAPISFWKSYLLAFKNRCVKTFVSSLSVIALEKQTLSSATSTHTVYPPRKYY